MTEIKHWQDEEPSVTYGRDRHLQIVTTLLPHGESIGEYAVHGMDGTTGRRYLTYGIADWREAREHRYRLGQLHGLTPHILQWNGYYWTATDASPDCMHHHPVDI